MRPEVRYMGVIVEPHRAEMHREPMPPLGAEEVLIRMETCNICTTDYQQWMGLRNHQGFPMAGGHEWAGIVEELGEAVTADLQIGDRVSLCSAGCGQCDSCRAGLTADCQLSGHPGMMHGYYGARGFGTYVSKDQDAGSSNLLIQTNEKRPKVPILRHFRPFFMRSVCNTQSCKTLQNLALFLILFLIQNQIAFVIFRRSSSATS